MTNIYETPTSNVLDESEGLPKKPGVVLKSLLIVFTLLACGVSYVWQMAKSHDMVTALGGGFGPILWGFVFVGLFQIGKRFRNSRSRYKIFLWPQIVFFISGLANYFALIGQTVNA